MENNEWARKAREMYPVVIGDRKCCGVSLPPGKGIAIVEFATIVGTKKAGRWKGFPKWDSKSVISLTVPA